MIYLLQDCYKDNKGEYHDILKIGYSKDNFSKNRQGQYNTHNFGYKFLGEREGSCELENYLHKLLKKYNLSREWFIYSDEVIDKFWKTREEDISDFSSQDELNEYIRYYILKHLVPSVDNLKELYLDQILSEISEKDIEYEEYKDIYKREIMNVFEFVSSHEYKYFQDLDFNTSKNIEILKNCDLTLPQIVGRQRNRENPFKNNIVIFYRTIRKTEIEDRETFDKTQEERRKETQRLLDGFNLLKPDQQKSYLQKLERDSEKYIHDFVGISKKTGKPVYNSFIDIANERSWEVSQKDYQDKISVTKSLESISSNISEYQSDLEKEIQDFLDNKFYKTGLFHEKMKMYCEFMDKHKENKEVSDIIYFKIKDPKYRKYYNFYGTKGCSIKDYEEKKLEEGMIDVSKNNELSSVIRKKFKVNSKYTLKEIKLVLQDIYRDLEIASKAKATDLEKYFNLTKIKFSDTVTGKRIHGYLLKNL